MLRKLDEKTMVSGQILPGDIPGLAQAGVTLIVNNRPDGEDADQPPSAAIEQAARDAGLEYRHVPIRRGIGPADVELMQDAMRDCANGKLLAFCRSGHRSALAWAVARAEGGMPAEEVQRLAAKAGVDISPVAHLL